MAILVMQVSLASAQEMETGTGADASASEAAPLNIIMNEDGSFSADRDDVSVEFVPDEETTTASVESAPVTISADEESLFSLRRITKWGGVVSGILLIIFVLMQEKGMGLSSTFGGSGGFYASKRGAEKILFYLTIASAIAFVVLNLLAMTL